jgi:hypothetical protein
VHRKPEGRFQHLVLLHPHPEAQHDARNEARQLAGQLDPAAVDEQIDDRPIERLPANGGQGLRARPRDDDAPALALEQPRYGPTAARVAVDEQDVHAGCVRWEGIAPRRSNPRTTPFFAFSCT